MPRPPVGLAALSVFFAFGAVMSGVAALALLTSGGPLEPLWRINPRAREDLQSLGPAAVLLMAAVSGACGLAARGLWTRTRWGWRFALALLAINVLGDVGNALLRDDARTLVGVPIGGALIAYLLSRRVRAQLTVAPSDCAQPHQ